MKYRSIFMALLSAVFMLVLGVNAGAETTVREWKCGETVSCVLKDDGEFVVSGEGPMYDYSGAKTALWSKDTKLIRELRIEAGVTRIGIHAFQDCSNLRIVDLSLAEGSLETIGVYAFKRASSLSFVYIPKSVSLVENYVFEGASSSLKIFVANTESYVSDKWSNYWNRSGSKHHAVVYEEELNDFYQELISGLLDDVESQYLEGDGYGLYSTMSLRRLESVLSDIRNRSLGCREEYEEAIRGVEEAVAQLKYWTKTVVVKSEPEGAGLLSGGGLYADDEEIVLDLKPGAGYEFRGWYEDGVLLSDEPGFIYMSDGSSDSEIGLTACFEAIVTKGLSLDLDGGTVEYGMGTDSGVWMSSFKDLPVSLGQKIELKALGKDNAHFMYWVDLETMRILSRNEEFVFRMRDEMKIMACYKEDNDGYLVTVRDLGGKLLFRGLMAAGSTLSGIEHGNYAGHLFGGWRINGDAGLVSDTELRDLVISSDLEIEAVYEKETGFEVRVNGELMNYYAYGERVTVVAADVSAEGLFAGWYVGEKCVSRQREFSFYVTGDVEIRARYEAEVSGETDGAFIDLTVDEREVLEDGRERVHSVVRWCVMAGSDVIDGGLIRSFNEEKELVLENVDGVDVKVSKSVSSALNTTYDHSLVLGETSRARDLFLRSFVRYLDVSTGEVFVVYSDVAVSKAMGND